MGQIVPGCENEQPSQNSNAGTESVFLGLRRQWAPTQCLCQVEKQMAAIQNRDREQVDQTQINREHSDKGKQAWESQLRHLARQLGDAQWPTQLLGAALAAEDLAYPG